MGTFEWDEGLRVGINSVDDDHRLIIAVNNLMVMATQAGEADLVLASISEVISDYLLIHFRREMRIMEACRYPKAMAHGLEHSAFEETMMGLLHDDPAIAQADRARKFSEMLSAWVTDHVGRSDRELATWIATHKGAAAQVEHELLALPDLLGAVPDIENNSASVDFQNFRVLIVAKSDSLRRLLTTVLRQFGVLEIELAESCDLALPIIESRTPSAVVCEPGMRDCDDHVILREMRRRTGGQQRLPVIFLVGAEDPDPAWKATALDLGAAGFLNMPVSVPFLSAALTRLAKR